MDDFRLECVLKCFNINVPHYRTEWPFLCFSLDRRKRGQKKTYKKYCVLQSKTKNDEIFKKAKKKRGQHSSANNGTNATSQKKNVEERRTA